MARLLNEAQLLTFHDDKEKSTLHSLISKINDKQKETFAIHDKIYKVSKPVIIVTN